jgi:nitrogen fixation NifU-like protein
MSGLAQLYQELILDHHKRPRNAGRLSDPSHSAEGNNPLCGDRLAITLRVGEERILGVACEVSGCALCRASGSLLTEAIQGRSLGEVELLRSELMARLACPAASSPEDAPGALGPLLALLSVRQFPSRVRCVTLAWETLQRALAAASGTAGALEPASDRRRMR